MNEEQTCLRLIEEVEKLRVDNDYADEGKAFVAWYLLNIVELPESELEGTMTDGKSDTGADAIFFLEESKEILIIQGKFSQTVGANPVNLEEISKTLETRTTITGDGTIIGNSKVRSRLKAAREKAKDRVSPWTVQIQLITNKDFSQDVQDRYASDPTVELVDLATIKEELEPDSIESPNITAELKYIPGQFFISKQVSGSVVTCTIQARELVELYKKYSRKLFWRNIRFDLGRSKPVNKGISRTLQDQSQRGNFWLFNNGVTILCDVFKVDSEHSIVKMKNVSIINGAQTTSTLAAEAPHLNENVQVLVKIIQPTTEDEDLIRAIVQYTNKQTATVSQDFISNDKHQLALVATFKDRGYFYDLKRGLWESLGPNTRNTLQRLRINDLAYAVLAFHGLPSVARNAKRLYFQKEEGGYYSFIFSPDRSVDEYIFIYELSCSAKETVSDLKQQKPNDGYGYTAAFMLSIAGALYRSFFASNLSYEKFFEMTGDKRDQFIHEILLAAESCMSDLIRQEREGNPELDLDNLTKSRNVDEIANKADVVLHPRDREAFKELLSSI